MSQVDADKNELSETIAEQVQINNSKLVPVTESIRYRRRAQGAEKQIETLAEQLVDAQANITQTTEQLNRMHVEQKLMHKLAAAGVVDLEAAVLIASSRIDGKAEADLDGVVEQLKNEKQYLFGNNVSAVGPAAKRTAGARDRMQGSGTALERAAKKAATTGNRSDLQEYLKLRRNFV